MIFLFMSLQTCFTTLYYLEYLHNEKKIDLSDKSLTNKDVRSYRRYTVTIRFCAVMLLIKFPFFEALGLFFFSMMTAYFVFEIFFKLGFIEYYRNP